MKVFYQGVKVYTNVDTVHGCRHREGASEAE